jgi:hypothetical protein
VNGSLRNLKDKNGTCRLCGKQGVLSFEHTPPQAAFNKERVLEMDAKRILQDLPKLQSNLKTPEGLTVQKGSGGYTLCDSCNNNTGSWYAGTYVGFAHQGMSVAHAVSNGQGAVANYKISPLNVLKHIVLMFLTANTPEFASENSDLVGFVNDRNSQILPREHKFYIALSDMADSKFTRQSGMTGLLKDGVEHLFSEIAYPPFVLVYSRDSQRPDGRLQKINYFRHYKYDEQTEVGLQLFSLPIVSPLPADYRTYAQMFPDEQKPTDI